MTAQGKTWPVEGVTPDAQNPELQARREIPSEPPRRSEQGSSQQPQTPTTPTGSDDEQRRKRSRSRKRKPTTPQSNGEPNRPRIIREGQQDAPRPEQKKPSDPTFLSLR